MDTLSTRALVGRLAEDLAWLEQHARRQDKLPAAANQLRLAAALVRNCIGPFVDQQQTSPLHVAVIGGAGAGKSTISNMLAGAIIAESNPQAGFTRHPIAYTNALGPVSWASHFGFFGPLTRLTEAKPSSLDQDVYQVRRVSAEPVGFDLLKDWVVWDCPDLTTRMSDVYIPRLIEAAAVADVIVYVASDERYNDEAPTQFLSMLLKTGKPVVCCLLKMRESDAPALVEHFRSAVLERLPEGLGKGVMSVLAIPYLNAKQLADPIREAAKWRIPLLNQVAVLGTAEPRRRSVVGGMRFLTRNQQVLFESARADVTALETWQGLVRTGQSEFEQRYNREYLASEKFRGFDDALVKLMELLDLPGIGQIISGSLYVLRTPYRLLRGWIGQAIARPEAPSRPEQPILEDGLNAWIDLLHKESARKAQEHELWRHLANGFVGVGSGQAEMGPLPKQIREKFHQVYRDFQTAMALEVDRTARAIYEKLAEKPVLLNTLRGSKLGLDLVAIGGAVWTGGLGYHDIVLIPLIASLTHQIVEIIGKQAVDDERERTRQRQYLVLQEQLTRPLGDWLVRWPATGGSAFERLQLALQRAPQDIAALDALVNHRSDANHHSQPPQAALPTHAHLGLSGHDTGGQG